LTITCRDNTLAAEINQLGEHPVAVSGRAGGPVGSTAAAGTIWRIITALR
jgi:hypothetical protein